MDFKKVPILGFIFDQMDANGMDYGPLAAVISISLFMIGLLVFGVSGGQVFSVFLALMPIWLPIILFFIFFYTWMGMVGQKFWLSQGRTTLRIKLPQEVLKSPEAMEIVLSQVHATQNPDNLMQTYLDGKQPIPMSLEIASIGGEVRLYANVPTKKVRNAFESNMYAQYPGVELVEETVDYAAEIPLDGDKHNIFSLHLNKKKDQEFPIKTYIDYGLDKMPKEEEKVDPMTPMLEVMAAIKSYERLYVQIICVPHREAKFTHGQLVPSPTWEKGVSEKVDEIMKRDPETKDPVPDEDGEFGSMPRLTPAERDNIEAMERNAGKYAYETNMRFIYVAEKDHFNADNIAAMVRAFSQYDIIGRNQIGARWRTDFDYPFFSDRSGKRLAAMKRQELKEFKSRKFFAKNGIGSAKIFTAEELATMWHLPGTVALTPTLNRIPSTRGEAPANLPTGELPQ